MTSPYSGPALPHLVNADPQTRALIAVLDDGEQEPLDVIPTAIGSGADAVVHGLRAHPDFVVKLYHDPAADPNRQAKLEAMLQAVPDRCVSSVGERRVVELAWPETLVRAATAEGASQALGFVMPAVNLTEAVLLVEVLSPRARRSAGLSNDVRFRVTAAANLAASVAALHAEGHHVIDLKPANLHVYRSSALVAILDCDGMSIGAPDGTRYPAHQYTDGYIAPEALQSRARPEDLGEPQDRFALAVIVFQLLNNGLHPFQGVPNRVGTAPTTNGERIAAGLYPYGSGSHTLAPPPASPFPFLDSRTQTLFQRAFDSSPDARPSAREWRDHLRELLETELAPCDESGEHARFGDKLCATCELDPYLRKKRQRAAYAARRHLPYTDEDEDEAVHSERAFMVALFVMGLLVFIGYGCGVVINKSVALVQESDAPLTLSEAIASHGFAEIVEALNETPDEGISRTTEEPASWPYGPRFDIADAWHATYLLDPLPGAGLPPLHQAAFDAKPYVTSLLLTRDVDVNAPDARSRTPLMYAASSRVAPNAMTVATALDLAARTRRTADIYRGRDALAIFEAFSREPFPMNVNGLEIHTISSSETGPEYTSFYASSSQVLTVQLLLDAGADVNAQDRWGRTPLAYAARASNGAALWQLIDAGADPNLADVAGVTPLMLVADQVVNAPTDALGVELAALLLVGGADASQTDNSGRVGADFVSSPHAVDFRDDAALVRSVTLSLLDAASQPDWSPDVAWLRTGAFPLSGRPPDAANAADVGDWKTDFSTPESEALAATLPSPPWNETLTVTCPSIPPERFAAELQLAPTQYSGIAEPAGLQAPDWLDLPEASAEQREQTPDIREQRDLEARARERCLARARLSLPRRFDVRESRQLEGPVWVEVARAGE